jgi:2'-5' RNA ligase
MNISLAVTIPDEVKYSLAAFVPHITSAVSTVCANTAAFPIHASNFGFYGTKRFPHNVWAAIDVTEVLTELYEAIWNAMKTFGFKKPDEEFHPHIVLGICKTGIKNQPLTDAMHADEKYDFGAWDVKKVTLYDCKTSKRGKVHRKVNQIPLLG